MAEWDQQKEQADAEEQIDRCANFSDHVRLVVTERKRAFDAWSRAHQVQAERDKLHAELVEVRAELAKVTEERAWLLTQRRIAEGKCAKDKHELENIVSGLADCEEPIAEGTIVEYCALCKQHGGDGYHKSNCPWQLARDWVKEHAEAGCGG